jgi:hypothetical protein
MSQFALVYSCELMGGEVETVKLTEALTLRRLPAVASCTGATAFAALRLHAGARDGSSRDGLAGHLTARVFVQRPASRRLTPAERNPWLRMCGLPGAPRAGKRRRVTGPEKRDGVREEGGR